MGYYGVLYSTSRFSHNAHSTCIVIRSRECLFVGCFVFFIRLSVSHVVGWLCHFFLFDASFVCFARFAFSLSLTLTVAERIHSYCLMHLCPLQLNYCNDAVPVVAAAIVHNDEG